jgi:uncharacterized DUF497 family protein
VINIRNIIWIDEVIEKIYWKHQVLTDEVEEVFSRKPLIFFRERGRKNKKENVYVALGTTESGRYLFVLFILKLSKEALILSARDMTRMERKYYEERK